MTIEFEAFPKIPRFSSGCVITEKIDGTNACVIFDSEGNFAAQSRKRLITPQDDNYGFARWVYEHAHELYTALGPGRHFGEWWGIGVGPRGYGLVERRFSLFNVGRWSGQFPTEALPNVYTVPVIFQGQFSTESVDESLAVLRHLGSLAAPGYDNPEGIVVCHLPTRSLFKKYLDPKTEAAPKSLVTAEGYV